MTQACQHRHFNEEVPRSLVPMGLGEAAIAPNQIARKQPMNLFPFNKGGNQGSIVEEPFTQAVVDPGSRNRQSVCSTTNEAVDAFLANAAKQGSNKDRTIQRGVPFTSFTKPNPRFALPGTLSTRASQVANVNVPDMSLQRGAITTSTMPRHQVSLQGTVDLEGFCPCTLEGHDCGHPAGEYSFTKALTCTKLI